MSALGDLGREVLRQYGIEKIDPTKQYSYKLRRAIHDAAYKRFGECALYAFGFNSQWHYPDWVDAQLLARSESEGIDQTKNKKKAISGLNFFVKKIIGMWNDGLRSGVKGGSGRYGCEINQIDETGYSLLITSTSELEHESFQRGAIDSAWVFQLTDAWDFSCEYNEKLSEAEGDWSTIALNLRFTLRNEIRLIGNIASEYQRDVDNKLLVSVLNETKQQNKKVEILSEQLGKYVPPQIHQALLLGKYDTGIATRRKKLTIFFSDIKNFTSTSEGLQPEDLTKYLNEYFSEMTSIALNHGATIDKYIGDAMMVFFGDPDTKGEKEDARKCVEMALTMQERMTQLQEKWKNEGFAEPFQVRMGINTGYCNVGNFGSDQRLTYTIIGGEVNVAQRLETAADANGIFLSYESFAHAQDMINVEQKEAISMKGISREIKVYSVVERKTNCSDSGEINKKEKELVQDETVSGVGVDLRLLQIEKTLEKQNKLIEMLIKRG